jgi:hypothetical protein
MIGTVAERAAPSRLADRSGDKERHHPQRKHRTWCRTPSNISSEAPRCKVIPGRVPKALLVRKWNNDELGAAIRIERCAPFPAPSFWNTAIACGSESLRIEKETHARASGDCGNSQLDSC